MHGIFEPDERRDGNFARDSPRACCREPIQHHRGCTAFTARFGSTQLGCRHGSGSTRSSGSSANILRESRTCDRHGSRCGHISNDGDSATRSIERELRHLRRNDPASVADGPFHRSTCKNCAWRMARANQSRTEVEVSTRSGERFGTARRQLGLGRSAKATLTRLARGHQSSHQSSHQSIKRRAVCFADGRQKHFHSLCRRKKTLDRVGTHRRWRNAFANCNAKSHAAFND